MKIRSCVALLACAGATQSGRNIAGSLSCPCLTAPGLQDAKYPGSPVPMNLTYGVGCHAHDTCASSWCQDKWCYVGAGCDLAWSVSNHSPIVRYSYATCGYQNRYTTALLAESLAKSDLKVVYLSNSGGWKGSYCTSNSTCQGALFDYVSAALRLNVRSQDVLFTDLRDGQTIGKFPAEVLAQVYDVNPSQSSAFTTCVYATHMGYIDICIGAFLITASRNRISNFVPIFSDPIYLITSIREEGQSFWEILTLWSVPFEPSLWATLVAFHIVLGIVIIARERHKGGSLEGLSWPTALRAGLYQSFGSVLGFSSFSATNFSGKMVVLATGILVLFSTATYTANLASQLVVHQTKVANIQNVDQVMQQGARVCCIRQHAKAMNVNTGMPFAQMVIKESRGDVLPGIAAGDCRVAVMSEEDLQAEQTTGAFCNVSRVGDPIYYLSVGVPISDRYQKHLQQMFTAEYTEGRWLAALDKYRPANLCDVDTLAETPALKISGMLGVLILVLILVVGSFLAHWKVLEVCGKDCAEAGDGGENFACGDPVSSAQVLPGSTLDARLARLELLLSKSASL